MAIEVVPIRNGKPSLNDIPAQLRAMADGIEAGEFGEVPTLFVVMPIERDFPMMWGWGDVSGDRGPIVQLNLAMHWHCRNITARSNGH